MASTEHEPITRVWGRAPSGVQEQSSWSWKPYRFSTLKGGRKFGPFWGISR